MPFSPADLLHGGLIPAVVAAVLSALLHRRASTEYRRRLADSIPFVTGFHIGYWLIPLGKPTPVSHWEWLPWVLLLSWVSALPVWHRWGPWLLRSALILAVVVGSSCVLVPTWEHLNPSRTVHIAVLSTAVTLLSAALAPMVRRLDARVVLPQLALVLTAAAIVLALSGSLRFAQMAGCGVSALLGMMLPLAFHTGRATAAGITLPYMFLLSALMLIGRVNSFSDVPDICYVLLPLAPLAGWALLIGPGRRSRGGLRWGLRALPLLPCLLAVGLAAVA